MLHYSVYLIGLLSFIALQYVSSFHRVWPLKFSNRQVTMKSGLHGENFKYLPILQGKKKSNFPRIIQIAGIYPNISPEQLLAPKSSPAASFGTWVYDFSDPSGPQLGTIAVPGSIPITEAYDPVAVIAPNNALGVKFVEEVEMVVIIDRGNVEFNSDDFFAFRTPENEVVIKWSDVVEDGYDILGKVVMSMIPFSPGMVKEKSGFLEDEEDDGEDDD